MRIALALCTTFLTTSADAMDCDWQPDRLSILVAADHVGTNDEELERFIPGVFGTWDCHNWQFTAGGFSNSYGALSPAATAAYAFHASEQFEIAAFAGLSNYGDDAPKVGAHYGDWVPLAGLQLRIGPSFIQIMPGPHEDIPAILAGGFTFELGM